MVKDSDARSRWCAAFAALLVVETDVSATDADFLAEQVRALSPGLPPSYALRRAMSESTTPMRIVAGRVWRTALPRLKPSSSEEGVVGW